ncbi:MAG: hypothetical protein KA419_08375 [Acidobacteria bacterium]|jgi:cytochrome c556|nr:hypothetical protein [Acidobacteriota bacterium]
MKKVLVLLAAVAVFLPLSGCSKGSHEAFMNDMIAAMKEMGTVLEGIKDKDSAKAAVPKLQEIVKRLNDLKEKGKALPEPDEATKKKLEEKLKELMEVSMKVAGEMMRVQGIEGAAEELKGIQSEMSNFK